MFVNISNLTPWKRLDALIEAFAEAMMSTLQPDVRARYSELGQQRAEALSPAASGSTLLDFLSEHLGLSA